MCVKVIIVVDARRRMIENGMVEYLDDGVMSECLCMRNSYKISVFLVVKRERNQYRHAFSRNVYEKKRTSGKRHQPLIGWNFSEPRNGEERVEEETKQVSDNTQCDFLVTNQ